MFAVAKMDVLARRTKTADETLVRFGGYKIKEQHGPEYFCGFSKRPVRGADGRPCYVAAEFVKDRDSRGRPRRTPIRVETFQKRLAAADQSLDWFLSHVKREGANGSLSRTQRKQLTHRLRKLGFRVSISVPDPLRMLLPTPAEPPAEITESGACALSDPTLQYAVQELADCSELPVASASDHVPAPVNSTAREERVSVLLARVWRGVGGLVVALCGFRRERASCANQ